MQPLGLLKYPLTSGIIMYTPSNQPSQRISTAGNYSKDDQKREKKGRKVHRSDKLKKKGKKELTKRKKCDIIIKSSGERETKNLEAWRKTAD